MSREEPDYNTSPALRTIAMPAQANANGDIFGGWLLSQMDLAGAVIATQKARSRIATIAIDAMKFTAPVHIGDEVSCYATIERIGNTSITILVETWARSRLGGRDAIKVTEGKFTYVAIDEDRKPIPVIRDTSKGQKA
ncbi:MAG TPA: acyl-CoA thioesterase [Patescibacteria group bacterium]|nr:acyl-CoA thioesterase [Patescibacteria group bacterium]